MLYLKNLLIDKVMSVIEVILVQKHGISFQGHVISFTFREDSWVRVGKNNFFHLLRMANAFYMFKKNL